MYSMYSSNICAFVRTPFAAISTDDANSLMSYFQFLISFPKCDNAWVTHLQTEATGRRRQRETDRQTDRQAGRPTDKWLTMDAFCGALTIVPNGRKMQKCCVKNANFSLPFSFCVVVVFVDLNERTNELRTRFSEYVYVFYIFLLASD